MTSKRDDNLPGSSVVGEESDDLTMSEKGKNGLGEASFDEKKPEAPSIDESADAYGRDIEAQGDDIGVERVETSGSRRTQTHQSILTRLSTRRSRAKENLPPPVLPVTDLDNGVVGWESQDDPEMPLNFNKSRKWLIVSLLSTITFTTPFASSILAPAIIFVADDFGISDNLTLASMPVSIFLLGYAVGPLFLSPLSEIYGRNIVLLSASAFFCTWLIGCALAPSIETLIFFRFMSGIGGSACQTIGGAVISDVFIVSERGRAITIWMLGPMVGPTLGPVIGGFVSQSIGWRWLNWIVFVPATLVVILMVFLNPETNHQVLMGRKTERLRRELNRPELRSCYVDPNSPALTKAQILLNGLVRPIKMLFTSLVIFGISLYIAFAYGCLYILFNTIPLVFQGSYGWSIGLTGLVYISLLIGFGASLAIFSFLSDKTVVRMTEANGGAFEPEMRLPFCIYFALIFPISFFWYGWSADQAVHWAVPVIGIIPFGLGIVGIWMPMQAYIIDAYPQYAASGLAAFSVFRSIVAAFLPLAGPRMYDALGVGWGTSLLGFIAIAMIPIPALLYRYGKLLRDKYPLQL